MTFPPFREIKVLPIFPQGKFESGTNSIFILKTILDLCKEKHAQRPCVPSRRSSATHVPCEAITPPTPTPLTLPHPPIRCRDLSEFFLNFERKEKITLSGVKNNWQSVALQGCKFKIMFRLSFIPNAVK